MTSMMYPVTDKIAKLASSRVPQLIYSYRPGRLVKFGTWILSVTFLGYGLSFADWSISSTLNLFDEEKEKALTEEKPWYKEPSLLLAGRLGLSSLMVTIPLALSVSAIYLKSRILTNISYIPGSPAKFEMTRFSALGREIKEVAVMENLTSKSKIYTGVGKNGMEDRSSFFFFVTDSTKPTLKGLYIFNRSADIWKNDGRIFDLLFRRTPTDNSKSNGESATVKIRHSTSAEEIIKKTSARAKVNGFDSRDIVRQK
ncbi:HHL215Wp [Eremothecium sinecaudum]|uniref:HHL215Wp n=1 Tax=Eremothecium sinecaudum TaxID=45286 RepID=A0A0X8HW39_9SACH|nr:HHL215Wp [Eremothecium sinecaudum]AMD22555.1 HHL215Wp [Eremothecium sinecaudum]